MQELTDKSGQESKNSDRAQPKDPFGITGRDDGESSQKTGVESANNTATLLGDAELAQLEDASRLKPIASTEVLDSSLKKIDLSGIKPMLDLMRQESDGRILVSLFAPDADGRIHLRQHHEVYYEGRWHSVPFMAPALLRSLVLPTAVQTYPSAYDLFFSVRDLLKKHAPLSTGDSSLVAYWSMATWFPDCLQLCPTLVVTGEASAANLLLRTLVAVCRRPLLLADVSPAVLRALPLGQLTPTLLIRSSQADRRMITFLDSSTYPGFLTCSKKDFQQLCCPKCIYVGEGANDELKVSNSIRVHVHAKTGRPFQSPPTQDVIKDFQNRLFAYRLFNREQVTNSNFRVVGFASEMSGVAEALGATIVDSAELQNGITLLLQAQDEQSRVDRAGGQTALVLRAVLSLCHQTTGSQVVVREIAATANRISAEEGEVYKLSNERVGHLLKNVGLYSRRLGSAGRGLVLDKQTQGRAHRLCKLYGVFLPAPGCSFCQTLQDAEPEVVKEDM